MRSVLLSKRLKRNLSSESVLKIILLILIGVCSYGLYKFRSLLPEFLEIFQRNFGEYNTGIFILVLLGFFSFFFFVGLIIWSAGLIDKKPLNWWFVSTILIILYVFLTGIFFIDYAIGTKDIELVLRDTQDNYRIVGNISCSGSSGVITAGQRVICDFEPKLINYSAFVTFKLANGSLVLENINNLTFIAPEKIKDVAFSIQGVDAGGREWELSVSNAHNFPTLEEYEQNRGRILRYILALLAIVLFSIPSAMVNFKSLYRNKNG